MNTLPKTKIVATIGPSTWDNQILRLMYESGMRVARINASFADFDELKRVSGQIREISPRIPIILDTQGNKIRVKNLQKEVLVENQLVIYSDVVPTIDITGIQVTYPNLYRNVIVGSKILIDDGNIELRVSKIDGGKIICDVIQGGVLRPNKTVNIPDVNLTFPVLTEKDRQDIMFAVENNFDYVCASFVRNKEDVHYVRELIGSKDIGIISKIENREGVNNFDEILEASDGVMIARGDLAVEIDYEEVPILQKQMIHRCRAVGKPVIVATQMLESMRENIRATRAEVSDVANAIMDGTDCIMLSAETSTGKYPLQAIRTMAKIAKKTEEVMLPSSVYGRTLAGEIFDEVAKNLNDMINGLPLKAIIVISNSTSAVGSISRHRPRVPIYVVSSDISTVRRNAFYYGVKTYYIKELSQDRDVNTDRAVESIYTHGELDLEDKIAIISNSSIKNTAILEILTVKDAIK